MATIGAEVGGAGPVLGPQRAAALVVGAESDGAGRTSCPQPVVAPTSGDARCLEMEISADASVAEVGADSIGSSSNGPSGCDTSISVACCSSTTRCSSRWRVGIASIVSSSGCMRLVVVSNGLGSGGNGSGGCASADLMPAITSSL
jgi:hypothetical protein